MWMVVLWNGGVDGKCGNGVVWKCGSVGVGVCESVESVEVRKCGKKRKWKRINDNISHSHQCRNSTNPSKPVHMRAQ